MPEFASSAGSSVAAFVCFFFGGVLFRTVQSASQDVEACRQRPLEGHGTVADFSAVQRRGSCTHFVHQRCAGEPDGASPAVCACAVAARLKKMMVDTILFIYSVI